MSRKEREREFKKKEIISAAIMLFAEKGYEHTTLDEIAEAAEFGKGTLYNYFQNKEDLYLAILEDIFGTFVSNLRKISEESKSFFEFINKFTEDVFTFYLENKSAYTLLVHERLHVFKSTPFEVPERLKKYHEESEKIHRTHIDEAIRNGEIVALDVDKILNIYKAMVFAYIFGLVSCSGDDKIDVRKETEFVTSVLFNGILKEKNNWRYSEE
jgi:AcrR family transcriptional regulator